MNTLKRYRSLIALMVAFLGASILASAVYAGSFDSHESRGFSNRSVKGNYGFSVYGVAVHHMDGSTTPAALVGRLTANGKGDIVDGFRVLNTDGSIFEQRFTGSYSVNADGTGEITLETNDIMPDGTTIPASIETANFVIVQPNDELQLIGTDIKGPDGADLGFTIVTRGVGRKQSRFPD